MPQQRELIPLFSGPGHVTMFYFILSLVLFAPPTAFDSTDVLIISGIFSILGYPAGTLINHVYNPIWERIWGYQSVGFLPEIAKYYSETSDKELLAIFDSILWKNSSEKQLGYFRRRWATYHLSAKISLVSIISTLFPPIISNSFDTSLRIGIPLCSYYGLLLLVVLLGYYQMKDAEEMNFYFLRELAEDNEKEIYERIEEVRGNN